MKPVHSFLRAKAVRQEAAGRHGHRKQPLTDYSYQTHSFGNARSEGRETPSSPRSSDNISYSELRREARDNFFAEAALFAVLTIIAVFGLVICARALSEFLRLIAPA